MKLINTTYINANVADCRKVNNGDFTMEMPVLPTGEDLLHRLYLIKAVIPYNWQTVYSPYHQFTINTTTYTLTTGIPNILDFIANINSLQNTVVASLNRIANKINYQNTTASSVTLSSTCALLGLSGTLPIPANSTVSAPNLVDMRPSPVIQFRCNLPTAMWEVINTGNSEIRNTSILAVMSMGNTPLYGHFIWRAAYDAHYEADVKDLSNALVSFQMLDTDDVPIIPQTPPIFIFAVDTYRDDEAEILDTQKEILKLSRYDILLRNQALIKQEPTPVPPQ